MQKTSLSKAYSSQYKETILDHLPTSGEVPKWLSGNFVSNGPAQFEVGSTYFNHWFDGFAMLKKFDFKSGTVRFQNRFLQSKEYIESTRLGKLNGNEFATYASKSIFGRIHSSMKELIQGNAHDNCVVNTAHIANTYIAMTESKAVVSFDLEDLSTTNAYQFMDDIPGHFTTAHPHFDINTGECINILIEVGKTIKYHIYTIEPLSKTRKIICTHLSDSLFYLHSFNITNHYIILVKSPLVMSKYKLLLGLPYNNALSYQENLPSGFIIIDRRNGKIHEIETESLVCLHGINAYEYQNDIMLDLICHHPGNPYNKLYLSNLRSNQPILPTGEIRRYSLNIQAKTYHQSSLSPYMHEFPRINDSYCNGHHYQFVYTNCIADTEAKFFNAIQKLNVQTGETCSWNKTHYYLGEPVFVNKPNGQSEDDGALLSIAFNAVTQLSSLLILDALSMQIAAEVYLPLHLPFGLHGNFYHHAK